MFTYKRINILSLNVFINIGKEYFESVNLRLRLNELCLKEMGNTHLRYVLNYANRCKHSMFWDNFYPFDRKIELMRH